MRLTARDLSIGALAVGFVLLLSARGRVQPTDPTCDEFAPALLDEQYVAYLVANGDASPAKVSYASTEAQFAYGAAPGPQRATRLERGCFAMIVNRSTTTTYALPAGPGVERNIRDVATTPERCTRQRPCLLRVSAPHPAAHAQLYVPARRPGRLPRFLMQADQLHGGSPEWTSRVGPDRLTARTDIYVLDEQWEAIAVEPEPASVCAADLSARGVSTIDARFLCERAPDGERIVPAPDGGVGQSVPRDLFSHPAAGTEVRSEREGRFVVRSTVMDEATIVVVCESRACAAHAIYAELETGELSYEASTIGEVDAPPPGATFAACGCTTVVRPALADPRDSSSVLPPGHEPLHAGMEWETGRIDPELRRQQLLEQGIDLDSDADAGPHPGIRRTPDRFVTPGSPPD